ncbi:uncharacterized protein H6S33_011073 [Morchella sextelata]|uniref:uncharacterized protein n=1 Tax=Morchella sextelata TaxID=1174677 RepID=UPI001D0545BA|nr:uncharacterized protein H6S33_011073 [Morchella sextelata]KAH0611808.1 hypothetical protein H6S33_011073 [Morchella sextelata]
MYSDLLPDISHQNLPTEIRKGGLGGLPSTAFSVGGQRVFGEVLVSAAKPGAQEAPPILRQRGGGGRTYSGGTATSSLRTSRPAEEPGSPDPV